MNNPPILSIRAATPADNLLLAELGRQAFFEAFAADNTPEDMAAYLAGAFSPEKQAAELADPATRFLIAEAEGAPAGFARLRAGPAPDCVQGQRPIEIVRFYSLKAWIGRGVGPALMRACLEHAEQAGYGVVWLDVWELNPRAIAFYRKWGFETVGTQAFQLGSDRQTDLLMSREVATAPL